jgi:oxygen-dependent protoporphyrinogen oxidase
VTRAAPNTNASPRIAIIGGGITGLAAAHRLTELLPDPDITLFEASDRLGGVLETVERDGFLIERSADNFLSTPSAAVDLCRRLGFANELLPTDESRRRAFVVREGELRPIPDGFHLMSPRKLTSVLTSPVLSLTGKLRLLAELLIPPSPFGSGQGEGADESVASFARRRLGREAFERLVQPLVAGMYTADPARLSMAATMPQFLEFERQYGSLLRATLRSHLTLGKGRSECDSDEFASGARYGLFVAPRGGMTSLVDAIIQQLPRNTIKLNMPTSRVTRQPDGSWNLDFASSENPQSAIRNPQSFDAIIIAAPAPAAAILLHEFDPNLAADLAAIEYAGCAVISLGFQRSQLPPPLDGFGFVVPQIENRSIIAASFASHKFPGRAPADAVLIRVFVGGALQPEMLRLDDDQLRRLALDELAELLHITGMPHTSDVARWLGSMPQYHVGHLARVARIEQRACNYAGLALAGNAYHGVGIPQCIASGQSAAERIAARFIQI